MAPIADIKSLLSKKAGQAYQIRALLFTVPGEYASASKAIRYRGQSALQEVAVAHLFRCSASIASE
jgi:hypothetical protein